MLNDRRIGVFEIGIDIINEHPEIVRQIMAKCIVVKTDVLFHKNAIEYTALAEGFEELNASHMAPRYDVEYDEDTGDVSWSKSE